MSETDEPKFEFKPTNESIRIEVASPLLRAGLTISTVTSKRYARDAAFDLLNIARTINQVSNHKLQEGSKE